LEDIGIGGRIILKWILNRMGHCTGFIWLRIWAFEHGNELSSSIKCWELLDHLSNWYLLNNNFAPWS
jgi:hypothetical protein